MVCCRKGNQAGSQTLCSKPLPGLESFVAEWWHPWRKKARASDRREIAAVQSLPFGGDAVSSTRIPRQLDPMEIRVLGSLLEKEQTTPEAYPLTVNAVLAACNQKTNRDPVPA